MEEQSRYLKRYKSFMGQESDLHLLPEPSGSLLKRYRTQLMTSEQLTDRQRKFDVRLDFISERGDMVEYIVDLGRFRVTINLLNLQGNSPRLDDKMGGGCFGTVTTKSVTGTEFVAKVMNRSHKTEGEMEDFIREVAISKLCAMFGIGPDVETSIPFDLIVYEDAVQFHLQKCEVASQNNSFTVFVTDNPEYYKRDLTKCIKVLHSLHIVHKDIKPDNILYCPRLHQFVLCDFGCSEYVKQNIGGVTYSHCDGTPRFMGPEMIQLYGKDTKKKIDLYYNDVAACEILIEILRVEREDKYRSAVLQPKSKLTRTVNKSFELLSYCDKASVQYAASYQNTSEEAASSEFQQSEVTISPTNSSSDEEYQNYPNISKQLTEQSTERPTVNPNPAFKQPDSYEFYRLVYAATALNEHNFNLKENLSRLTEEQKTYIHNILVKSLNRDKLDQVLRELRDMQPKEGTLWKCWEENLQNAYTDNFLQHIPRLAEVPVVSRAWICNLTRLLGMTDELKQLMKRVDFQLQLADYNPRYNHRQTHMIIVKVTKCKKYRRLFDCCEQINKYSADFLKHNGIEYKQLQSTYYYIIHGMLSYDTKEFLLHYILQAFRQPTKITQPFLQCLAAVIKKEEQAANLLRYFSYESQTRICVCLLFLHHQLVEENSATMIEACADLLGRLSEQQPKFRYMETLNVRRIQFLVRISRLELDHRTVRLHFEESLKLVFRHSSNQDSSSILWILSERLGFFQQFQFPLEEKQVAHMEFEQCRQFYSGMENINMDRLVMNTYRDEDIQVPEGVIKSELDNELLRLNKQQQSLIQQGNYRSIMEVRRKIQIMQIEQQRLGEKLLPTQRDIFEILQETNLLWSIGQIIEADRLLRSAENRVLVSPQLIHHRNYYYVRAQVSMTMDRHQQAYNSCVKAIDFNDRLGGDRDQVKFAMSLRQLQAQICLHLEQFQRSIDILEELRNKLLHNNGQRPDYHKLASNYISTAQTLRAMGKLHDSMDLCNRVFKLKQQNLIHSHESAFAHVIMAQIYGDLKKTQEQVLHSWKALQGTKTLGNENSCLIYTIILRAFEPIVGNEALSLISYARKFSSPPREILRGKDIDERLYESPVPSGLLPLDMPAQLHKLVSGNIKEVLNNLPTVIDQMISCHVAERDKESKQQLVEFAKIILSRNIKALPDCPKSKAENFDGRKVRKVAQQR